MSDPVNSTILLLDIEKYSDRDDVEQSYLRRMLFDLTDHALLAAGIEETLRRRADRGDSVMELIDSNASLTALLRTLLTVVPAELRARNRLASSSARMRLRGVVATGYVAVDREDGWVGSDLNHACRLLDAEVLRQALRESPGDFVLCVSEPVYLGVVQHNHPGVAAEEFHAVTVDSKNGALPARLHRPLSQAEASGTPDTRSPARDLPADSAPRAAFDFGGATVNGGTFGGTNHGIGGGSFHGDIHLGGALGERA
ncbi:hypothetical protein OG473_15455 [Streptomyces anulatus]|uniref:hypothetical protein n=1 Tax=Streptomyces anulatus TaxID=1892 RepID=UPI00324A5E71|nr:hypothetical protein OG238_24160 [Streptomyces anulatus]WSU90127.1 hypothetical protein OG575_16230 [Streptomyces anulatus]